MDKDNRVGGGLNMRGGECLGQGKVIGKNGDNCNWTTIKNWKK